MPLIKRADILVEQFRPGVMERLRLGYDDVRRDQPTAGLLLDHRLRTERSARPRGRPRSQLHRQHRACWISAGPAERPVVPPALVADIAGGSFPAVINILLAYVARPDRAGLPSSTSR